MIDNIPGAKVEEDTETHHVLAENLYKPRRRVTHTHDLLQFLLGVKVCEEVLSSVRVPRKQVLDL